MVIASLVDFIETLRQSRLLTAAQLDEVRRDLQARFSEPRALAKELVQRGWLTPYQINHLFQGQAQDLVLGSYVLLERLGEGGMGQVFKARHQKLDKIVALKVIRKERLSNPDMVRRFYREIQAAAQLSHPNIVHAYDADEVGGTHFFAMEYVEGIDLAKLLKQRGPLPVPEACDYIRQAALGLQHAFEKGLVHRDIKPGNLLVVSGPLSVVGAETEKRGTGETGNEGGSVSPFRRFPVSPEGPFPTVKLLDMGLARLRLSDDSGDSRSTLTREGTVMGTLDYIAPEQAKDSRNVDIRADLYSLGCTLYQLLTGQVPFPKGTAMEKLVKHQVEEPPAVEERRPDVPPGVAAIIRRLMAKRRDDRFHTPAELAAALEPFCPGCPGQSTVMPRMSEHRGFEDSAPATPGGAPADTQSSQAASTPPPAIVAGGDFFPRRADLPPLKARLVVVIGISSVLFVGIMVAAIVSLSSRRGDPGPAATQPPQGGPAPSKPVVTVQVEANKSWQDTGVEVEANMPITIRVWGWWKIGPEALNCSAEGQPGVPADRSVVIDAPAMCLLARVGHEDKPSSLGVQRNWFPRSSGRLFVQANDLDLEDNSGVLTLEIHGVTRKEPATPPPPISVQADDAARKRLAAEAQVSWKPLADKLSDPQTDLEALRKELLAFRLRYPGTPSALRAAEMLMKMPSPLDQLDAKKLPQDCIDNWKALSQEPPKELVAVLGEHRQRHWGKVTCVAYSPDGKTVASGGEDRWVRLWSAATGRELRRFQDGHPKYSGVLCVAFSRDGRFVASGTYELIHITDLKTGKRVQSLHAKRFDLSPMGTHAHNVLAIALSPNGKQLASAHQGGGIICLWDLQTGRQRILAGQPGSDYPRIAFSPDGKLLASTAHERGTVKLWSAETGGEVRTLPGHPGHDLRSLAFHPTGKVLASAARDSTIKLWDTENGRELGLLRGHAGEVSSIAFSPDGRTLASASLDQTLKLWEVETAKEMRRFEGHGSAVTSVAFSREGQRIVSGGDDGTVRLWDVETGKEAQPLSGLTSPAYDLVFDPEDRSLAARDKQGVIKLWEFPACSERHTFLTEAPAASYSIANLAFSPDGKSLIAAARQGQPVKFWDPITGQEQRSVATPQLVVCLAVSPDGETLAAGGFEGDVRLWNLTTEQEAKTLKGCPDQRLETFCVAFSPHGKLLAKADWIWDRALSLWDVAAAKELRAFRGHEGNIYSVAFSPSGRFLASGSTDGTVRLWDVSTSAEVAVLQDHQAPVRRVAFAPDGGTLATAGEDGRLILWDISSRTRRHQWQLPGAILGLAFAADGRHLATANANGTVYILRLAAPPPTVQGAVADLKKLLARFDDPNVDRKLLRDEVVQFRTRYADFPQARQAVALLPGLPSPLDDLNPAKMPEDAKASWRAVGFTPPAELVAVLGEHRQRHWGSVARVTYSRDGKLVASSGDDGYVRVWDAATGRERLAVKLKIGGSSCLAFSPDGETIAAGYEQKSLGIWHLATGELRHILQGHPSTVAIVFSTGNELLSAGSDGTVKMWDVATGKPIRSLSLDLKKAHRVWLSPDGQLLVSAHRDSTLQVWDIKSGRLLHTLTGHTSPVSDVAFSPDGKLLASGNDAQVATRLWDLATGKEIGNFPGHGRYSLAFSPDGKLLASGEYGIVQLLDVQAGKLLRKLPFHTEGAAWSVTFDPAGKLVAAAGPHGAVRLWDVETGKEVQPLQGHLGGVAHLAFSPDDRRLLTGGVDGSARLWDVETGNQLSSSSATSLQLRCVGFSSEGPRALGNHSSQANLVIVDVETAKPVGALEGHARGIASVGFFDEGRYVLSGGLDNTMRLWDFKSRKELRQFTHPSEVAGTALSGDGRRALSGDSSYFLRLWDVESGRELASARSITPNCAAFSPDAKLACSGYADGGVIFWDVQADTLKQLAFSKAHTPTVLSVAFVPGGKGVVSCGPDKIVLWDPASGGKLREWQLPGPINGLAIACDGRHLATANSNGTVYILRLIPPRKAPE